MENAFENAGIRARMITPDDGGHYFFGYYDLQPFDSTGRYHLCHKAPFEDHIPEADDICQLGVIDLQTGEFIKYAETNAWNFQQGTLLRWFGDDDHILYNVRQDGAYRSCIQNIKTGEKRILPMAVADVSRDCKYGLCVNFSRIFDFRAGYGYAGIKDPFFDDRAPEADGVFLMDMKTGETRQILDYKKMRDAFFTEPYSRGKLLVNHINFNPSGTHYAMLFRNFSDFGTWWRTQLLTGDLEGNLHKLSDFGFHSHYNWKNDDELLIFSGYSEENRSDGLWLFKNLTDKSQKLPQPNPERDVHCLYSPNRRYIMGDDYPDAEEYRRIHLIDTQEHTDTILGRYKSAKITKPNEEIRCDLHARFDPTGRYVSFDSVHTGRRAVFILDLQQLAGYSY